MEALAYRILQMGDIWAIVISYGLFAISTFIGARLIKSEIKIGGPVYFLTNGVVFFANGASTLLTTEVQDALKGGYLAVLVALIYASSIPTGIFLGAMAAARARDAYGSSSKWFYGIIPFVNLALIFTPSQVPKTRSPWRLIRNAIVIVVGFALAAGGKGLERSASQEVARLANQTETDMVLVQKSAEYAIQSNGIEATLKQMASTISVPIKVDGITTMTAVEVEKDTLRYIYQVSKDGMQLSQAWHDQLTNRWCGIEYFKSIMSLGASVEGRYVDRAGKRVGVVKVNNSICSEWERQLQLTMEDAARAVKGPQKLDDVTTIENASYANRILTYNYTITQEITDQRLFHDQLHKKLCTSDNFKDMYELDIIVKFVYHKPDGSITEEVAGDKQSCAKGE